jgi:transposase
LFRYQLICPALDTGLSTKARGRLVREIAAREHTDPFGAPVKYSRGTLDRWIRRYRAGGFVELMPSTRAVCPRTDAATLELAAALKRENPARTAAQVARILRASAGWAPSESTLLRLFHRLELIGPAAGNISAVFGRFEAENPNDRWTGDALHGPKIGGRKTYLFAFLDDHSRLITGYRFGFSEDTVRLGVALEPALASRGVPASVCRQRIGVRGCLVVAGLRETGDPVGAFHPAPPPKAAGRSNGSFGPCVNSSSSKSPTPPRRICPRPAPITAPHCSSSTGC